MGEGGSDLIGVWGGGSADGSGRDQFSDVFTGGVIGRISDGFELRFWPIWRHFPMFL